MSASRDTSSSGVTSRQEEQRLFAHAKLIHHLADQMDGQEMKAIKDYLLMTKKITWKQCDELDRLPAIVNCLEMEMKLTIGERDGYKVLIDALKIIKKDALADEVEQHQKKFCTDGEADKADKNQSQELLTQLASKNAIIESLKTEKEELRDELSDLKKLGVAKSGEISNLRGLQSELDSLRKENHQLRSQVEEYRRKMTTKDNDYRQLQEKLTAKENDKRQLQEKLTTKENDNKRLQERLTTKDNDYRQLQVELDTTKKKFQEQGQEAGVQGAVGGAADIQRYQGQGGVELAKGPRDIERCREVFKKEYGKEIQSIVNLGDRFAVAYRDRSDKKIKGVDIYDIGLSRVKQQTLKDNIEGLRDLAVTPDKGTLVAVCREGRRGPYTIREFDPVRGGFIRSTPQFQVDGWVQGFDVCDGQQFVILHGADKVSLVNEDGSVVLTEEVKYPSYFISCGGRHVFLSRGLHYVDVYEITEDRHLKHIATSQRFDDVSDVPATAAGEVTVTCKRGGRWCLGRSTFKDNKFSEWKYKDVDSRWQELVSVGGDHVVVVGWDNNGRWRILRVFKEEAV